MTKKTYKRLDSTVPVDTRRRVRGLQVRRSTKRAFSRTRPLPTQPGKYYWTEWQTVVEVTKKKGGKHLYVTPPGEGRVEVRISPAIAGDFLRMAEPEQFDAVTG